MILREALVTSTRGKMLVAVFCSLAFVLCATNARAGSEPVMLNGSVWCNDSNSAILSNVPATTPAVFFNFTTSGSGLDFDSLTSSYNLASWLEAGGVTGLGGNGGVLNEPISGGGDSQVGEFFLITGTITIFNGESFTATQEGGLSMYINGVAFFSNPSPTTPLMTSKFTYSGPTTTDATLDIVYDACCGEPAVLQTNVAASPEPGTMVLLCTGLVGLGGAIRRLLA
jgi:PEP-CTERM motif